MENNKENNIINTKLKEEKNGIIKKYPYNGRSIYLIDKFYIIGYDPNQFNKLLNNNSQNKKALTNIAKRIKNEELQSSNLGKSTKNSKIKLSIDDFPTLLNEISNDYKKKLPDIDLIKNMLFPNKPNIYIKTSYTKKIVQTRTTTHESVILQKTKSNPLSNDDEDSDFLNNDRYGRESVNLNGREWDEDDLQTMKNKQYNMIFSYNPQEGKNSKKSINGFAYIFYKKYKETMKIEDVNFTFYTPMTFCIISEYPYFNSYHKLCKQIIHLFRSKKNEIPLEIILYNIINFSMSPINGDILLNIEPVNFPSDKTVVDSIGEISKNKQIHIIKEEDENENDDNCEGFELYRYDSQKNKNENEENNLFDLKKINDKYDINESPILQRKPIYYSPNTDKKKQKQSKKKIDIEKNDLDLEKSKTSPDFLNPMKKRKLDNKILESPKYALQFKPYIGFNDNINYNRTNKKHGHSNYEDIKFQTLSGYPLIHYNLSKVLLHKLSPQDVIIIFFYSFLEKDILFFSNNLEYLSFTINSYLNLNFPLNDEKYYFFNACVSYDNFINDNSPFVGATFTSILGINSAYNSDYLKSLNKTKLKDHLAVDLDNGVIYQIDDPNNKDTNIRNKTIFDCIKKICKKEIKDDKVIIIREIKILYDKLESFKNNNDSNQYFNNSSKNLYKTSLGFIDYDENGPNSIKMNNRNIQEGFYRLINYMCLYFYQNLSLKSDDDKEDLNKIIIINRKKKDGINPETMNIIFHKDYNIEENNYTKEEICLLDELIETMKFESFVYGFIQSYNPIDLYKIPLTVTEEFISILSRKNFVKNQNINFFSLIDNLYKKSGIEKAYIDFNPFSAEYCKKIKNYFDREIYDENNCKNLKKKGKDKYVNVLLNQNSEGKTIDYLKYDEYFLDNNLLIKYIRYLKNLKKEEYYHMFHLASSLEQNKIKNITTNDIENEIEKYSNNLEISSKKDICCSNIILLFILSLKSIKNYIDCQSFLSGLFQNFNVFRKYYTMIMNLVYRLMNDCLEKKDYINARNYFFCYYSCINSLRSLKLVPNENLMNIILNFDKIDLNDLLEKASNCKNSDEDQNNEEQNNIIIEEENKSISEINIKESNQIKYIYIIYNFIKSSFIKEDAIIQKVNELKGKKTLKLNIINKEGKIEKVMEPKIKFNNGEFEYQCLISTQDKILEDLNRQYELYITDLNENKLDNKILFESCLNVILFIRNTDFIQDIDDILDTFKVIFNVYLQKIYLINQKNSNINVNNNDIKENEKTKQ